MKHCVYRFKDKEDNIIYVGYTNNINRRIGEHFGSFGHLSGECYNEVFKIEYSRFETSVEAKYFEASYISEIKPKYNIEYSNKEIKMYIEDVEWMVFEKEIKLHKKRNLNKQISNKEKIVEFDLGLTQNHYFLHKDIFYHKLSIVEIRVLLLLSTKKEITIRDLDSKAKMWCVRKSNYRNSDFDNIEKNLIECKLLNEDGTGLLLEKNFIIFRDLELFDKCKTIKQLFVASLNLWTKNHSNIIVSIKMFKALFPNKRAFVRACKSLDYDFSYQEKQNKIYIFTNKNIVKNKTSKSNPFTDIIPKIKTSYIGDVIPPPLIDIPDFDIDIWKDLDNDIY